MLSGLVITIIAYYALVFYMHGNASQGHIQILEVLMLLIIIARLSDYLLWRRSPPDTEQQAKLYKTRFKVLNLFTASLWAITVCFLSQYQSVEERYFTLLMVGSMTGGAVNVLSPSRLLAITYPFLLIVPISIVSLFSPLETLNLVGLLGLAYGAIMLGVSKQANVNCYQMIRIKNREAVFRQEIENERNELSRVNLVLNETKEKLDTANSELEAKVERRTAEIYRLSNLDPLTNILNRNAFLTQLSATIKDIAHSKLAVLFIDLNGFKAINDGLGHHVGDTVLIKVAQRLSQKLDKQTFCRWGGDEFVCFIQYETELCIEKQANAILFSLAKPIAQEGKTLQLSACLGVARFPLHSKSPQELIEQADLAMYKVKKMKGQGFLFFDQALKTELTEHQRLMNGLKSAIKHKELNLVYQPIVAASNHRAKGMEALLRWQFEGNAISPEDFIPLAEKTGQIIEIGEWVLIEACQQLVKWQGIDKAYVSVNISAVQLASALLISSVKKALSISGLLPERLHLEITETSLLEYSEQVRTNIAGLKNLGVEIAIDDFGMGYSNLSQLKDMPANTIKIDKAFVDQLAENDSAILDAVLLIAQEYRFKTVAEGVETAEQVHYISGSKIDSIQGYFFCKPLAPDDLELWWMKQLQQ